MNKVLLPILIVAAVVGGWLLTRGDIAASLSEPKQVAMAPAQRPNEHVELKPVTWAQLEPDGTIPVGVWSAPVELPVRCGVTFEGGEGQIFVGQYQYYSNEWKDMQMGHHYSMNKFRLKMLKPGRKALTFKFECKDRPY